MNYCLVVVAVYSLRVSLSFRVCPGVESESIKRERLLDPINFTIAFKLNPIDNVEEPWQPGAHKFQATVVNFDV